MTKFKTFEVTCIDPCNAIKPKELHHLKWLRKNKSYTVEKLGFLNIIGEKSKFNTGRELFKIKGFDRWFAASMFEYDAKKLTKLISEAEEVTV
jgi:hypothetical protein